MFGWYWLADAGQPPVRERNGSPSPRLVYPANDITSE